MLDPKLVESLLQLGALGIMAVFISVFMLNTFKRQQESAQFMQELTAQSIEAIKEASAKSGDTARRNAEAMASLSSGIIESQKEMQDAFRLIMDDVQRRKEKDIKRSVEHEQMLRDHREIMRGLERIQDATA